MLFTSLLIAQSVPDLLSMEYNSLFTEVDNEIWIGSINAGYNRYRGIDTKYYRLNDSISGLFGSAIQSAIFKDDTGKLWTTTYENLCFFDKKKDKFTCYSLSIDKKILRNGYHIFHIDTSKQLLWMRASDQLFAYNYHKDQIELRLGNTSSNYLSFHQDSILGSPWHNIDGFELWTKNNERWKKNQISFTNCPKIKTQSVIRSFLHQGKVWLITPECLLLWDSQETCNSITFNYKNSGQQSISEATLYGHKIFITTENDGLQIFDLHSRVYIDHASLERDHLDKAFISSDHSIWLSNPKKGIQRIPLQKLSCNSSYFPTGESWTSIEKKKGLTIYIEKEKKIVLENSSGNLRELQVLSPQVPTNTIIGLKIMDSTNLVFCGLQDCYIYNTKKHLSQKINLRVDGEISDIDLVNNSLFFIAGNRLYVYDFEHKTTSNPPFAQSDQGEVIHIGIIASEITAQAVISTFIHIQDSEVDTLIDVGAYIQDITWDRDTRLFYVATNNGLFKIDSKYQVSKISLKFILGKNESVYNLQKDEKSVYFTSENQVLRLDKQTGIVGALDHTSFTYRPSYYVDEQGIILGTDYIENRPLSQGFQKNHSSTIILDKFLVNGIDRKTSIHAEHALKLSHQDNSITFEAYVNNLFNSELAHVEYSFSADLSSWERIQNGEAVRFPILAPAKYTLQLRGILPTGHYTDVQEFTINIRPPWYNTFWFYAGLTALLLFASYIFYRFRIKQIQEKYRVENEINHLERSALQAQMNPHFIFNCLNSIQRFIMKNDKEQAMEYLSKFAKLIRQYLQASNSPLISIDDEISMLRAYCELESLRFTKKFDYNIAHQSSEDIANIMIPPMLIQPFVENAIIHGMKKRKEGIGKLAIEFDILKDGIGVRITDNGPGIDLSTSSAKKGHKSLGMSITKQRLTHINKKATDTYSVDISSSPEGTSVEIHINRTDNKLLLKD